MVCDTVFCPAMGQQGATPRFRANREGGVFIYNTAIFL